MSQLQMVAQDVYVSGNLKFDLAQVSKADLKTRMVGALEAGLKVGADGLLSQNGIQLVRTRPIYSR
jgi:hypothetical protein